MNSPIFPNFIFLEKPIYVIAILVILIIIFSHSVIFDDEFFNANNFLYKRIPWNAYPPSEFGNFNSLVEDQAMNWDSNIRLFHEKLYTGDFPLLWNSDSFAGIPFGAVSLMSPFSYLYFVLPPIVGFKIVVMLKLFFAGIFQYYFLRELKLSPIASLISAILFMFSAPLILNASINEISSTALMFPVVFYFSHRLIKQTSWKNFVFLSISFSVFFISGHIETTALFFIVLVSYFILFSSITKKFSKKLTSFFASILMGISISSIHIFMFLNKLLTSSVWEERITKSPNPGMKFEHIITVLLPKFFGSPTFSWWGTTNFHRINFDHVGSIGLFLAIFGSVFLFKKNNLVKFFSIVSILFFGFTYGLPGFKEIFLSIPIINLVSHALAGSLLAFFICVLAGFGSESIIHEFKTKKTLKLVVTLSVLILFCVIAILATITSIQNPPDRFFLYENPLSESIIFEPPEIFFKSMISELIIFISLMVLLLLIFILRLKQKILSQVLITSLVLIVSISMLNFSIDYNPTSKFSEAPITPGIDFLKSDSSFFRIHPTSTTLEPDSNFNYDLMSIRGNDILKPTDYLEFYRSMGDVRANVDMILEDHSSKLLDLLGVKYVILKKNSIESNDHERFSKVFEDKSIKILENHDALPHAFMVYDFIKTENGDLPYSWDSFSSIKGWIKGTGDQNYFLFRIIGPLETDYFEYHLNDTTSDWSEFLIDLSKPEKTIGNPSLKNIKQFEISKHSSNPIFNIASLQLVNDFVPLPTNFWELGSFSNGSLDCSLVTDGHIHKITLKSGGNKKECFFVQKYDSPIDLSDRKIFEYWNTKMLNYQLYIFGPTLNDFFRYDVQQYSPKSLSKINVNLENPIEKKGNPDLSKVIQLRIDPNGGRIVGKYAITNPVLHTSAPLEVLYKTYPTDFQNSHQTYVSDLNDLDLEYDIDNANFSSNQYVTLNNESCNILSSKDKMGRFDPKFISKLPTHQPKDLYYFEKIEQKQTNSCILTLVPKYSQTLLSLQNPSLDFTKQVILNSDVSFNSTLLKNGPNEISWIEEKNNYQKLSLFTEYMGLLFISDQYNEDWNAYVDGISTPIYNSNWVFRTILVPPGEHVVEFKYEPNFLKLGLLISTLAISVLIVGSIVKFRQHKKINS